MTQTIGFALLSFACLLGLALPLFEETEGRAVAVVFPPWVDRAEQAEALAASGLYLGARHSPWVLVGFQPDGAVDHQRLRQAGAIAIVSQQNVGLCARAMTPETPPSPTEAI